MTGIMSILAIIISPILAVWIGQKLHEKALKREDKMKIFKTLMTARIYGWTAEGTQALNLIDVVFADSKKVIKCWREYYDSLNQKPALFNIEEALMRQCRLLLEVSKTLGYEKTVTWETVQKYYAPDAMHTQQDQVEQLFSFLSLQVIEEKRGTI